MVTSTSMSQIIRTPFYDDLISTEDPSIPLNGFGFSPAKMFTGGAPSLMQSKET